MPKEIRQPAISKSTRKSEDQGATKQRQIDHSGNACRIPGCTHESAPYRHGTDNSRHMWTHVAPRFLPKCPHDKCTFKYRGRNYDFKVHWTSVHEGERCPKVMWPRLKTIIESNGLVLCGQMYDLRPQDAVTAGTATQAASSQGTTSSQDSQTLDRSSLQSLNMLYGPIIPPQPQSMSAGYLTTSPSSSTATSLDMPSTTFDPSLGFSPGMSFLGPELGFPLCPILDIPASSNVFAPNLEEFTNNPAAIPSVVNSADMLNHSQLTEEVLACIDPALL